MKVAYTSLITLPFLSSLNFLTAYSILSLDNFISCYDNTHLFYISSCENTRLLK